MGQPLDAALAQPPNESPRTVPTAPLAVGAGHAWYVLALLALGQVINFMDRMLLNVLVDPIKAEFGATDTQMGLLTGFVFVIVYAAVGVPLARLADRKSRRNILAIGMILWSGMTLLSGLARSFAGLAAARMGVAAAESVSSPTSFGLIADLFPKERRPMAVAIFQSTLGVGLLAGFLIGGVIGERYGWRTAFWVAAMPGFVLALVLLMTVREPQRGATEAAGVNLGDSSATFMQNMRWLISRPAFMFITFGTAFVSMQGYAYIIWSASYLRRVHGLSGTEVGQLLALAISLPALVGILSGGLIGTWVQRRFAAPDRLVLRMCGLSMLLALPLSMAFVTAPNLHVALACLALANLIGGFPTGPALACGLTVVRASMRSQAASVWLVVISLVGQGGGALIVGMVSDLTSATAGAASVRYGLMAALVGNVLALVCYWAAARRYEGELKSL